MPPPPPLRPPPCPLHALASPYSVFVLLVNYRYYMLDHLAYSEVMALNGLESLYGLDMRRSEEMTAKDIMETNMNVVPCHTTVSLSVRYKVVHCCWAAVQPPQMPCDVKWYVGEARRRKLAFFCFCFLGLRRVLSVSPSC